MKIFMAQTTPQLGIGRVCDAYRRHLPDWGVEFVIDEREADLIVSHAGYHAPTLQTDVLICHGLYPTATLDQGNAYFQSNADVVRNAREAMIITVPSRWVAVPFQRDMHIDPIVVPHGVEPADWVYPGYNQGYVLWGKGHAPGVVDVHVVNELARRLPKVQFKTTMGQPASNVQVYGILPYAKMEPLIQCASVYLATTKETFGIQTLEAMACGVPVVGYKHGATPDIVAHGESGWLVEPGDIDGLAVGVTWALEHHDEAGLAARRAVDLNYDWDTVIEGVYEVLLEAAYLKKQPHSVSVVIPCYNYGKWLGAAVDSVLAQDYKEPVEIIVVDDGSNDNTADVAAKYGQAVRYLHKQNAGVAAARNHGVQHASGDLVACLDADDWWEPSFLSKLVPPMLADRSLGIAYGHLQSVHDNDKVSMSAWPPEFNFSEQSIRHNQVPSSCLFRRAAWLRAGGYRSKYTPAEDAELWLRIAALGYNVRKVTNSAVYNYRVHSGSLSRVVKEPDWVSDKPYSRSKRATPFAAPGGNPSHEFRDYDDPWVSIVIPVGPGHEHLVYRALDSLESQSLVNWEVIVVNDSDTVLTHPNTGLELCLAYPYITEVRSGRSGVASARNIGARLARSSMLLWLDADDWLLPDCLSNLVRGYNDNPCTYVYSDWMGYNGNGHLDHHHAKDFTIMGIRQEAIHPVTALVPKAWHNEIGGFDEAIGGWEDWVYYLALAQAGHCGHRVPIDGMVYDYSTGLRREDSLALRNSLLPIIRGRFGKEGAVGCSSCGKKSASGATVPRPQNTTAPRAMRGASQMVSQQDVVNQMVDVRENSGNYGTHGVVGARTRINYGRRRHGDVFKMHLEDQQAQPQRFIRVKAEPQQASEPSKPVVPLGPSVVEPPVVAESLAPDVVSKAMAPVPDDEIEVDITLLPLTQIKQLGLTAEDATAALDLERSAPKPRQAVIKYLENLKLGSGA